MIEYAYTEPVSKLLTLGRPDNGGWRDYRKMGFTRADIPELIRLVEDEELLWAEKPGDISEDEDLSEWYGQIHAWRALAQLKAEEAIPALLSILHEIDDYGDDWYGEESFKVFPMIGPAAIRPLAEYLANTKHGTWARVAASESLQKMVDVHPETKDECAAAVVAALLGYKDNDEALNGSMISDLVYMNAAREHLGLIEEAFKSGNVDEAVDGDFEDIQIKLGLREKRSKPRLNPLLFRGDQIFMDNNHPIIKKATAKEKNKRKQEKKSRKRNRRK
jgi:hypothetical protein